jgi:hypothetical protein
MQPFGRFDYAREHEIERKWREVPPYQIAPVSTALILGYVGQHVLEMPRFYWLETKRCVGSRYSPGGQGRQEVGNARICAGLGIGMGFAFHPGAMGRTVPDPISGVARRVPWQIVQITARRCCRRVSVRDLPESCPGYPRPSSTSGPRPACWQLLSSPGIT